MRVRVRVCVLQGADGVMSSLGLLSTDGLMPLCAPQ